MPAHTFSSNKMMKIIAMVMVLVACAVATQAQAHGAPDPSLVGNSKALCADFCSHSYPGTSSTAKQCNMVCGHSADNADFACDVSDTEDHEGKWDFLAQCTYGKGLAKGATCGAFCGKQKGFKKLGCNVLCSSMSKNYYTDEKIRNYCAKSLDNGSVGQDVIEPCFYSLALGANTAPQ
jgi:hypothetical protein